MRLTTKSLLAVDAMIDIALRSGRGPIALAAVSERQKISMSYLEQMFSRLRVAGLVQSTRGPGGGYILGRGMADISVADILLAVESAAFKMPGSTPLGGAPGACDELWTSLESKAFKFLNAKTLRTLVDEQTAREIEMPKRKVSSQSVGAALRRNPRPPNGPNSVFALGAGVSRP